MLLQFTRAVNSDGNYKWQTKDGGGVWLNPTSYENGHADHIEMAGQKVASIIRWKFDASQNLELERDVIFPQLRRYFASSDPAWFKHRNYARKVFTEGFIPDIYLATSRWKPGKLEKVEINGFLEFYHGEHDGLELIRTLFPSMQEPFLNERWILKNTLDEPIKLSVSSQCFETEFDGHEGRYFIGMEVFGQGEHTIKPKSCAELNFHFYARRPDEVSSMDDFLFSSDQAMEMREAFRFFMENNLVLETPDPILNTLFYMSKIRGCESIFDSRMGLVHSPGGGKYYAGVWANDQAEYMNPLFPYIGYPVGNLAAMNTYNMFQENIPPAGEKIWASFEMQGDEPCCSKDRGDAAMILYGLSHYLLASGDREMAEHFWPLLSWSVTYCESKKTEDGVISSNSDEMEGRLPTGDANLSTSSLYYGGLLFAADLAASLGKANEALQFRENAQEIRNAIEAHFGATIDGLQTYQYFDTHPFLRHWIALPLVVGIFDRKQDTLEALLGRLWTDNGVRTELNPDPVVANIFWDRGTLYALRGCFYAGETERSYERLLQFSSQRLLGDHVPYVVEAYPEGDMAHLSAESGLYCRVFTEGILGLKPVALNTIEIRPNLPLKWEYCNLQNVHAGGSEFSIFLKQLRPRRYELTLVKADGSELRVELKKGETFRFETKTETSIEVVDRGRTSANTNF